HCERSEAISCPVPRGLPGRCPPRNDREAVIASGAKQSPARSLGDCRVAALLATTGRRSLRAERSNLLPGPSGIAASLRSSQRPLSGTSRLGLRQLDQLDPLAARPLDHRRAGVAEPVRPVEDGDALAAQLGDPGVEIADAEA